MFSYAMDRWPQQVFYEEGVSTEQVDHAGYLRDLADEMRQIATDIDALVAKGWTVTPINDGRDHYGFEATITQAYSTERHQEAIEELLGEQVHRWSLTIDGARVQWKRPYPKTGLAAIAAGDIPLTGVLPLALRCGYRLSQRHEAEHDRAVLEAAGWQLDHAGQEIVARGRIDADDARAQMADLQLTEWKLSLDAMAHDRRAQIMYERAVRDLPRVG